MCCHANLINETTRKSTFPHTTHPPLSSHLVNADRFNPGAALHGSSLPSGSKWSGAGSKGQEITGQRSHPLLMSSSHTLSSPHLKMLSISHKLTKKITKIQEYISDIEEQKSKIIK